MESATNPTHDTRRTPAGRFAPGCGGGNPAGRPATVRFAHALGRELARSTPDGKAGEVLARRLVTQALAGDQTAALTIALAGGLPRS
jgi:hypothetical protein